MTIILIVIGLILYFYIRNKTVKDNITKANLLKLSALSHKVELLSNSFDKIDFLKITTDVDKLHHQVYRELVILKNREDTTLNLCPKCGDTLTAKNTTFYGRILGCPNYPECKYSIKVNELDPDSFDSIHIK